MQYQADILSNYHTAIMQGFARTIIPTKKIDEYQNARGSFWVEADHKIIFIAIK